MLKKVERLVRAGFAVHRLKPKSKAPIGADWADAPVASLEKLHKTYHAGENLGVRLGKWSKIEGRYLHLIDLDVRKPDQADTAMARLEAMFPEFDFDSAPVVLSGSGGGSKHFYLLCDKAFSSKKLARSVGFTLVYDQRLEREVKKFDWEIELFGTGKQAVIPPSIHPDTGREYTWLRKWPFDEVELGGGPVLPSVDIERALNAGRTKTDSGEHEPLGLTRREMRQVLNRLPVDEWCEDRDGWLAVGMALHHETGGSEEGFDFWCEFSEQSAKFNERDQWRVWRSFRGKHNPRSMATLVAAAREASISEIEFENLDETEPEDDGRRSSRGTDIDQDWETEDGTVPPREKRLRKERLEADLADGRAPPAMGKFNKKHAVARVSGKTVVLNFESDGTVTYSSVTDLNNYYANQRVTTATGEEPFSAKWLKHPSRRSYPGGVVFMPNGERRGAYNLWQGFAIEPSDEGSCKLILAHMRDNLCKGNEEEYRYLLGWLAHMVQFPEQKPGVAVVIRGRKGVGKDTLARYISGFFPPHYANVHNRDHFLGKFNAHTVGCLLLHVEEAFWAGNKADDGVLKGLVTSETSMIEPKGVNSFKVDSYVRLFLTSNERWVVPASEDERRYFVLDAGEKHRNDHAYFAKIHAEADNGGREALLDYLLAYDLSTFNVRAVPDTAALGDQKAVGLRNFPKWFFEQLRSGKIDLPMVNEEGGVDWATSGIRVPCSDFRTVYSQWYRGARYQGDELSETEIGKELRRVCPSATLVRYRKDGVRTQMYWLPPLYECRKEFDIAMGSPMDWNGSGLDVTDEDADWPVFDNLDE